MSVYNRGGVGRFVRRRQGKVEEDKGQNTQSDTIVSSVEPSPRSIRSDILPSMAIADDEIAADPAQIHQPSRPTNIRPRQSPVMKRADPAKLLDVTSPEGLETMNLDDHVDISKTRKAKDAKGDYPLGLEPGVPRTEFMKTPDIHIVGTTPTPDMLFDQPSESRMADDFVRSLTPESPEEPDWEAAYETLVERIALPVPEPEPVVPQLPPRIVRDLPRTRAPYRGEFKPLSSVLARHSQILKDMGLKGEARTPTPSTSQRSVNVDVNSEWNDVDAARRRVTAKFSSTTAVGNVSAAPQEERPKVRKTKREPHPPSRKPSFPPRPQATDKATYQPHPPATGKPSFQPRPPAGEKPVQGRKFGRRFSNTTQVPRPNIVPDVNNKPILERATPKADRCPRRSEMPHLPSLSEEAQMVGQTYASGNGFYQADTTAAKPSGLGVADLSSRGNATLNLPSLTESFSLVGQACSSGKDYPQADVNLRKSSGLGVITGQGGLPSRRNAVSNLPSLAEDFSMVGQAYPSGRDFVQAGTRGATPTSDLVHGGMDQVNTKKSRRAKSRRSQGKSYK